MHSILGVVVVQLMLWRRSTAAFTARLWSCRNQRLTASGAHLSVSPGSSHRVEVQRYLKAKTTMAKATKGNGDEFGDAAFLANFDVDAAVSSSTASSKRNSNSCASPSKGAAVVNPYISSHRAAPHTATLTSAETPSKRPASSERQEALEYQIDHFSPPSKKPNQQNVSQLSPTAPAATALTDTSASIHVAQQHQDIHPELGRDLSQTLKKHFGHTSFRPGQLSVISALLSKPSRDVAIFWSTGSGKSLCYQLPPLHLNKIALVISPLISLMEDQVAKLNGALSHIEATSTNVIATNIATTGRNDKAVFLGSGQRDLNAEARALRGEYKIIYCTPEKLLKSDFLSALGTLHTSGGNHIKGDMDGRICLIAVDESHCVSEWGHDFRPHFRSIGITLRNHPILKSIPLLALTATAVPRVQEDIIKCLRMGSNVKVVKQTFDRENLIITILRKPSNGGFRAALKPLVDELIGASQKKTNRNVVGAANMLGGQSTIIYCSTRDAVDDVSLWLANELKASSVRVQPYHAGMNMEERTEAHTNFLIGRTTVIVATVAFGMGIDKPDTRRVIHYGPPKTVEEYYQQIGRAGRDGLPAFCTMYCDAGDFSSYKSDFYLGKLKEEAKNATIHSIDALRDFSMNGEICRRAALLQFFEETPSFGERCGTCDSCVNRKTNAGDLERDFGDMGARVVLAALEALNGKQGTTVIEKVLKGNLVDNYRYKNRMDAEPVAAKTRILALKEKVRGKKLPASYLMELLPSLVNKGFVKQSTECVTIPGPRISKAYATYDLTELGLSALESGQIVLPVPASLREFEAAEKKKLQQTLIDLKNAGVDTEQIPKEELEAGEGEVIKAFKTWHSYLGALQKAGRIERIDQLDDLRCRIEAWRLDMAAYYRMAPASVMEEHLMVKIAYAAASIRSGNKLEKEALLAVGVRSAGIDSLVTVIADWLEETQQEKVQNESAVFGAACSSAPMVFAPNEHFSPAGPWKYSVYKPAKKTGIAAWESSYHRFVAGEHPQTIAMSPTNDRPIQVATVLGHILEGLLQGRSVPMQRLATAYTPPTKAEWERLMQCEAESGMDVTNDPNTSGPDGGKFSLTAFLTPIMGIIFASKENVSDRTEEEKLEFAKWCELSKWYMTLRRVGYTPTFANEPSHHDDDFIVSI